MPTSTLTVSQSSDDAEESNAGAVTLNNATLNLRASVNRITGYRWQSSPLQRNAKVTAATITVNITNAGSPGDTLQVNGQAADNPGTFTTTTNDITSRTQTAASVNWTSPGSTGDNALPDLSAVIQEIVNRTGYTKGSALVILINAGTTTTERVQAYDGSATLCARLTLTWTDPPLPQTQSSPIIGLRSSYNIYHRARPLPARPCPTTAPTRAPTARILGMVRTALARPATHTATKLANRIALAARSITKAQTPRPTPPNQTIRAIPTPNQPRPQNLLTQRQTSYPSALEALHRSTRH